MTNELDKIHLQLNLLIQHSHTRSDIQNVLTKIKSIYDLASIAYFGQNIKPDTEDDPYLMVTYTNEWVQHYKENDYVTIDPVVTNGFSSVLPIEWSNFDRESKRMKNFFGEAREFGLGINGVTIPVRGRAGDRALLTITKNGNPNQWSGVLASLMRDFQIIAYLIHDAICRIENFKFDEFQLSPRETECLKWACRGKTVSETAIILSLSDRTVRFYLDSARTKLNATNVTHAASKALSTGIITTL